MRHTFTIIVVSALIGAICGAVVVLIVGSGDQTTDEELNAAVSSAVESAVAEAVEDAMQQSAEELASQLDETMSTERRQVADIFAQISQSVVVIDAEGPERTNDQGVAVVSAALATGFVLDEAGHIVTAAHVLEGMTSFTVILPNDERLPAQRVGDDRPFSDVAVLRVNIEETETELIVPSFGSTETVDAGETVIAIGNTLLGEEIAVTVGGCG